MTAVSSVRPSIAPKQSMPPLRARQTAPQDKVTLSTSHVPVPVVMDARTLWNSFLKVAQPKKGYDFDRFQREFNSRVARGSFDFDDAKALFSSEFTEQAWNAFVGSDVKDGKIFGNKPSDIINTLVQCFEHFESFNKATQIPFDYFSQCKKVFLVSADKLESVLSSVINNDAQLGMFLKTHQSLLIGIFGYITGRMFQEIKPEHLRALDSKNRQILIFSIVFKWWEHAEDKSLLPKFSKLLEDPVVAQKTGALLKRYMLEGKAINKKDIGDLFKFSKKINSLRSIVGDAMLNRVDPNQEGFNQVFELLDKYKTAPKAEQDKIKQEMIKKLESLRTPARPIPVQPPKTPEKP